MLAFVLVGRRDRRFIIALQQMWRVFAASDEHGQVLQHLLCMLHVPPEAHEEELGGGEPAQPLLELGSVQPAYDRITEYLSHIAARRIPERARAH
eukprot:CAMPEP_0185197136 /NCGR_PEP_ID=MMETSP1140-20130426/39622_1 /TAXON_ID=298111 /ORGANISM="Pavlova sp., Strain CCMP459" /LENGTH=94 /DNA_ID=CAMNT_0027764231 /DNA_START=251 /DNA_END=532 /DNA_ORIENTATION=-